MFYSSSENSPLLAFVHIEKTAGRSLIQILRSSFGSRHCDIGPITSTNDISSKDLASHLSVYKKLESIAGHQVREVSDLNDGRDINYFTMIREPISRCASHYQFQLQKMNKSICFEDWSQIDKNWNFQTKKIANSGLAEEAIERLNNYFFVGLTERFDESMVILKQLVYWKSLDIAYKKTNVAVDNSIKNKTMRVHHELLDEMNREDIVLYNYVKNYLFPKFMDNYTGDISEDKSRVMEHQLKVPKLGIVVNQLKRNIHYKPWLEKYNSQTNPEN